MTASVGSLFAGYEGIGLGLEALLDVDLRWVCEWEGYPTEKRPTPTGPSAILAHRYPDVPNHGDVTSVDWASVEPVDIMTGGSPCQDLSTAGSRRGMTEGTRSNLWVSMREAIATIRPNLVVWENVRGAGSATAASSLGSDPRRLATVRRKRDGDPLLRALGRVLGDLADLGFDAEWYGLLAADPLVGAPHPRFRYFLAAYPRDIDLGEWLRHIGAPADPGGEERRGRPGLRPSFEEALRRGRPRHDGREGDTGPTPRMMPTPRATDGEKGGPNQRGSSGDLMLPSAVALLPTPTGQDGANNGGPSQLERNSIPLNAVEALLPTPMATEGAKATLTGAGRAGHHTYIAEAVGALLPTPAVNDMGEGKTLDWWDEWAPRQKAADGTPAPHGKSLAIEAQRLFPTPATQDGSSARTTHAGGNPTLTGVVTGPNPRDVERTGGFDEAKLLPTPMTSVDSARHTTTTGKSHSGTTLTDASRLLPTPTAWEQRGEKMHQNDGKPRHALGLVDGLLPTPNAALGSGGQTSRSGDRQDEALLGGIDALLPTPLVGGGPASHGQISGQYRDAMAAAFARWGDYAPAILRWEQATGRPAPEPTAWSDVYRRERARRLEGRDQRPVGRRGSLKPRLQLSARFVEWMMGLPDGWVVDVPGVTRNQALKALGNGVVPQQAATALAIMLDRIIAHHSEAA